MAVYTCRIDFTDPLQLTDQFWSNVWYVLADDAVTAHDQANNIASLSALLIPVDCSVVGAYSYSPSNFGSGMKTALSIPGSRTVTGDRLPAWNVVQARWPVATIRPILKYLRMGLTEDDVDGQLLEAATIADAETFAGNVGDIPGLCTINGLILSGGPAVVTPRVCMRQLGWQRRSRVGFKRGWVPV